MQKRGQTSTEYIVIIAVVLVIALVAGTYVSGNAGISSIVSGRTDDYRLTTGAISVDKYVIESTHTTLEIRNNYPSLVKVDSLYFGGILCDYAYFSISLKLGESKIITCNNIVSDNFSSSGTPKLEIDWQENAFNSVRTFIKPGILAISSSSPSESFTTPDGSDVFNSSESFIGKYYGSYGDNYFYVVGYGMNQVTGVSGSDMVLKRIDSSGTESWDLALGDANTDVAYDVEVDSSGNAYVVGYGTNVVTGSSSKDFWFKKVGSDGLEDVSWDKSFDGGANAEARGVTLDSSENIYVVGCGTDLSGSTGLDWWLKKFDISGNEDTVNWNLNFDGNSGDDCAYDVAVDSSNNIYVGGVGIDIVPGGSAWQQLWIKKFSSTGVEDASWNKTFDFGGWHNVERIAIDSNNDVYILANAFNVDGALSDYWYLVKYNSVGVYQWDYTLITTSGWDVSYGLDIDSENNVYLSGFVVDPSNDWKVISLDTSGNHLWNKTYSSSAGTDYSYTISVDDLGNVIAAGYYTIFRKYLPSLYYYFLNWQRFILFGCLYYFMGRTILEQVDNEINSFLYTSSEILSELSAKYAGNREDLYDFRYPNFKKLAREVNDSNGFFLESNSLQLLGNIFEPQNLFVIAPSNLSDMMYYESCEKVTMQRNIFNNFLSSAYREAVEEQLFPMDQFNRPMSVKIGITRMLLSEKPDFWAYMQSEAESCGYSLKDDFENMEALDSYEKGVNPTHF